MRRQNSGLQVFNGPAPISPPAGLVQSTERPFFNRAKGRLFDVHAQGDVTEIELYDEIGFWGVSAKEFGQKLRAVSGGVIHLKINSPGGDVFDGIAMYNDLVNHPAKVHVEVTGFAASAASLIAMAGDEISIADNAFFMIHNAWTLAIGDRNAIGEVADVLEQIDGALALTYAKRTGIDIDEIAQMMDAETWLSGADAVDQGFADNVGAKTEAKAAFDLSCFANVPEGLRGISAKTGDPTIRDAERALRDAGFSRSKAKALASGAPDDHQRDAGTNNAFMSELLSGLSDLTDKIERSITR